MKINTAKEPFAAPQPTGAPRSAFGHQGFRLYWAAQLCATVATQMQGVAVGWQIYDLTHRPLDLGLVGLAQFLPGVLLFLITGHAADRYPRRRILLVCYASYALCSAGLLSFSLRGLSTVYPIYAVLLMNGVVRAFSGPVHQAFLPMLIKTEDLPNAVAWGSSIFQGAMVLGPVM